MGPSMGPACATWCLTPRSMFWAFHWGEGPTEKGRMTLQNQEALTQDCLFLAPQVRPIIFYF